MFDVINTNRIYGYSLTPACVTASCCCSGRLDKKFWRTWWRRSAWTSWRSRPPYSLLPTLFTQFLGDQLWLVRIGGRLIESTTFHPWWLGGGGRPEPVLPMLRWRGVRSGRFVGRELNVFLFIQWAWQERLLVSIVSVAVFVLKRAGKKFKRIRNKGITSSTFSKGMLSYAKGKLYNLPFCLLQIFLAGSTVGRTSYQPNSHLFQGKPSSPEPPWRLWLSPRQFLIQGRKICFMDLCSSIFWVFCPVVDTIPLSLEA